MKSKLSTSPLVPADSESEQSVDCGRRIRWERDAEDSERIVVVDAVTGKVIAIVRSLFEMCLK